MRFFENNQVFHYSKQLQAIKHVAPLYLFAADALQWLTSNGISMFYSQKISSAQCCCYRKIFLNYALIRSDVNENITPNNA
jgi:hypothetical protein